jgi:hypothetical protein
MKYVALPPNGNVKTGGQDTWKRRTLPKINEKITYN